MKNKIIISLVGLALIFVLYQSFSKGDDLPDFETAIASRGKVVKEILESGQVKKGEEISLGFNSTGKIELIYVEKGDEVEKGKTLAKLKTSDLEIQLQEAEADLKVYEAQLAKLISGASQEEIQKYETAVSNAQIALDNAEQNLEDVEKKAEDSLSSAYEDAVNAMETAYLKAYNASNFVNSFQRDYFADNTQEGLFVKSAKSIISDSILSMEDSLEKAKEEFIENDIDDSLSVFESNLSEIYDLLGSIREIVERPGYRNVVSSTDKTSLDTYKSNINTSLTNVVDAKQNISSTKTSNQYNINAAQASVLSAQGSLKSAQDNLSFITASPNQEDISLYQAQVEKAKSRLDYLKEKINDSYLTSPLKGKISEVSKKMGETVSVGSRVIEFLPESPYQIEVDIYEEDVVKMNVGNSVEISFIAFPDDVFEGEILSISPVEKIIDRVVYYETKISFKEPPEGIRPGMTADLNIEVDSKENVIVVPEGAVYKKEGKNMVRVSKGNDFEEREVEVGIEGSNGLVEIISGLSEGEKVNFE
jgi:HlyD family secretion protein